MKTQIKKIQLDEIADLTILKNNMSEKINGGELYYTSPEPTDVHGTKWGEGVCIG